MFKNFNGAAMLKYFRMKKKTIYGGVLAIAFAAITAFNINLNVQNDFSTISMENVEALANTETGGYSGCSMGSGYCAIYSGGTLIFSSYSHYPH